MSACEECRKLKEKLEKMEARAEAAEAALIFQANKLLHIKRILAGIPTAWSPGGISKTKLDGWNGRDRILENNAAPEELFQRIDELIRTY